ncbi:MAG: hypothetical protein LBF33_00380 [Oscillospiraceae bacterium]|jgi:hypothetical protein|nr:hypothetical protein [Oscillospiraceae bacterium]
MCNASKHVRQICKNSEFILEILDDKNQTHKLMKNIVPMLDYKTIKEKDFDYNKFCTTSKDLVVQLPFGSGGSKTYLINQENYRQIKFIPDYDYSVSTYQHNNTPYNIHCVISRDQIELFSPSEENFKISNIIEYIK